AAVPIGSSGRAQANESAEGRRCSTAALGPATMASPSPAPGRIRLPRRRSTAIYREDLDKARHSPTARLQTGPWGCRAPRIQPQRPIRDSVRQFPSDEFAMTKTTSLQGGVLRPAPFQTAAEELGAAPREAAPGQYPRVRLRRNRTDAWTRRLVAENRLSADDLIWP